MNPARFLPLTGCGLLAGLSLITAEPAPPPNPRPEWTDLGRVLEPSDFGQPAGTIIGDPTGVVLADGKIALFVFVDRQGVWRALSQDATGTTFQTPERCVLKPHEGTNQRGIPWGMPRVVPFKGGYRMFYMQDGGIASATSRDLLTWKQEPKLRITPEQAGVAATTTGSVVALPKGGYRMYFSNLRHSPADPATFMKSATSPDMLRWTMDPGVRIGPGAPHLDQNATDPFVLAEADGSVTAWYFLQPAAGSTFQGPGGLYVSHSEDGLTFRTSQRTGIPGGNPNVIIRKDGVRLMYLSAGDRERGPGIRLVSQKL